MMLAALLAVLGACGGGGTTGPSGGTAANPPNMVTLDDRLLAIAAAVPGFAGCYYDAFPMFWIALTDPSRADAARAEVARVFEIDTSNAQIREVKYDFVQLETWLMLMEQGRCASLPGLTMWDVDELHNSVAVGVSSRGSVADVRACGLAEGIPTDALNVVPMEIVPL
jgi:hypothetical protein